MDKYNELQNKYSQLEIKCIQIEKENCGKKYKLLQKVIIFQKSKLHIKYKKKNSFVYRFNIIRLNDKICFTFKKNSFIVIIVDFLQKKKYIYAFYIFYCKKGPSFT